MASLAAGSATIWCVSVPALVSAHLFLLKSFLLQSIFLWFLGASLHVPLLPCRGMRIEPLPSQHSSTAALINAGTGYDGGNLLKTGYPGHCHDHRPPSE